MKLACASSALHREIEGGALTQLEFLDLCAGELACDGVVLEYAHFPRRDDDYLAQVKKMATDRGLSIAALADAAFFAATPQHAGEVLECALTLGAPLVAGRLAQETDSSWSEQLARLGAATALAKARNVTLALRNAPGTFASSAHDCKRVAKETDSAWLRFGPEPQRFDAASDAGSLAPNTVLLWSDATLDTDSAVEQTIAHFDRFLGHVTLDDRSGAASIETMSAAMRRWRKSILDRR
jgi:hypothetical protein